MLLKPETKTLPETASGTKHQLLLHALTAKYVTISYFHGLQFLKADVLFHPL